MEELDTEQVEEFLTMHPNQDSLQLATKLAGLPLRDDSKLWNIRGIAVFGTASPVLEFFRRMLMGNDADDSVIPMNMNNFSGEFLFLHDLRYDIRDWCQLIRRWKRKEAYQNLKMVNTSLPIGTTVMFEHDMNDINFLEWDGKRRPRKAKLDPKIISFQVNCGEEIDCSHWLDIQQDGDGKWASIMLLETAIYFIVWD